MLRKYQHIPIHLTSFTNVLVLLRTRINVLMPKYSQYLRKT